jgi:hypothetical protein
MTIGRIDNFGNFLIEIPEHHVYIDEKNFFSKLMWTDRHKIEKEARLEAFSKLKSVNSWVIRDSQGDSRDRDVQVRAVGSLLETDIYDSSDGGV